MACYHHHPIAAAIFQDRTLNQIDAIRIESIKRFVEKHNARILHESASYPQPLTHS